MSLGSWGRGWSLLFLSGITSSHLSWKHCHWTGLDCAVVLSCTTRRPCCSRQTLRTLRFYFKNRVGGPEPTFSPRPQRHRCLSPEHLRTRRQRLSSPSCRFGFRCSPSESLLNRTTSTIIMIMVRLLWTVLCKSWLGDCENSIKLLLLFLLFYY